MLRKTLRAFRDSPPILSFLVAGLRLLRSFPVFRGERFYCHVPYQGVVAVQVPNEGTFKVRARGGQIENRLYWTGILGHEPGSMKAWLTHSKGARTVLDIGANSGVFALAASASGAQHIHAFEPVKRIYDILDENIKLNQFANTTAWYCAVGQSDGLATISDPGGDAPTSASLSSEFARDHLSTTTRIPVHVVAIDSWAQREGVKNVDLIKVDVEGYEEYALKGMREIVKRDFPVLLIEVLEDYAQTIRSVVDELWGDAYIWNNIEEGDGGPNRNVLLVPRKKPNEAF